MVSRISLAVSGVTVTGFTVAGFTVTGFMVATFLLAAGSAQAVTFDDIDYWVGSGANQAAFVVDWEDGQNPESLVWGYRWDGTATGEDMFKAVVQADPRLFAHVSPPTAFGVSPYGIGYDLDNDAVFGVSPALTFTDGLSVGSPSDGRSPTDPGDRYIEGWLTDGFWSYWLGGDGSSPAWSGSGTGMTDRTLTNNAWDAFVWAPGYSSQEPSEPVAAQVPEPASIVLLAMGTLIMSRRRRR